MAAGKINLQKASGGVTAITGVDGTGNTQLVLPESGTVATTAGATETSPGIIELATTSETQAGTDNLKAITPLKLKNSVIGLGQTRTDVTASRVLGTTYTNSTGKPILVSIRFSSISNGGTLTVGGISMGSASSGSNVSVMTTFIVMNGETYVHTGTAVIDKWIEVR